jgi:inorganic pyrophosphatase
MKHIVDSIQNFKDNNTIFCKLEKRKPKYMFGTNNYGEIIDTLNTADNDPWDIILPGYPPLNIYNTYCITAFEGAIVMPNGNHKLIVNVKTDVQRKPLSDRKIEIYRYRNLYSKICKKHGTVVFF